MVEQRRVSRKPRNAYYSEGNNNIVVSATTTMTNVVECESNAKGHKVDRSKRIHYCKKLRTAKFLIFAFCASMLAVSSITNLLGTDIPGLRVFHKTAEPKLNLRPSFLTDDGIEDEESEDEGDDVDDKGDDADDEEPDEDAEDEEPDQDAEDNVENKDEDAEDENAEEPDENAEEAKKEENNEVMLGPNDKIPRTLIFTHYKNLLNLTDHNVSVDNHAEKLSDSYTPQQLEEWTLATNVRHSIDLHKHSSSSEEEEPKVLFWTDDDCIASLARTRPQLVPYFKAETEGMYKADICRGTALLEHGGFYLDVDVGVRHDLWKDLKPTTEFVTARVHQASNWVGRGFFQAILGVAPQSPILQRYLELFQEHYDESHKVERGPLGVLLLYKAWDEVTNQKGGVVPTELYQEILFRENGLLNEGRNKGVLSPAPTWGKRRACHFVVAGVANHAENVELRLNNEKDAGGGLELQVPVFSRIPGSRMCVGEEKNGETMTQRIESMKWWERT